MLRRHTGVIFAAIGACYMMAVSLLLSWWYVPLLREGRSAATPFGGPVVFLLWAGSGALGAVLVALGTVVFAGVRWSRVLLLSLGLAALLTWFGVWSTVSHEPVLFGIGGGLILLFFLWSCWEWAGARRDSSGSSVAADLRLAGNVCFFIAAWGLCGLLGAPVFMLRPELADSTQSSSASTLATKVLVSLVLGWGLVALSHRAERVRRVA